MPTDTTVNTLVINKLTKAQYDEIQNPSPTELYLVPDEIDNVPTSGSDNPVKSGGIYTALEEKQDTIDSSHKLSADLVDDSSSTNKFTNTAEKTTWNGKQAKITASGILKGDGNGGISAALKQDIVDLGIPGTDTNTTYKLKIGSTTNGDSVNGVDLGTLENKAAASGGTDLSLVTTGEKYAWTNKASLDENGKVPSSQLPSYVDDVIDLLNITDTAPSTCEEGDMYYNSTSAKIYTATGTNTWGSTGETPEHSKIYVNLYNNKSYRWSGTAMVEIASCDIQGAKVGSSGTPITPSQGYIILPPYESGAQVNTITGVKGNSETNYRVGDVNITPANIGLGNVNNTADTNKEVKAAKAIYPIAYLDNNGAGMTVGQVKTWIYTQFDTDHVSVGDYVFVSRDVINNWDDDSHVVIGSSSYAFIKIAGGYTNSNNNQWLIAGYGNNPIGYVGRMYDEGTSAYAWAPITWFADLSAVEAVSNAIAGCVPKRANNMFYSFIGASPTHGNIFKVTMPSLPGTGNTWYMVTFELVLCGSYNNAPDGRIYTTYYFNRTDGTISAGVMRAVGVGSNIYNNNVSIKYDIQSPNIFYVYLGTIEYQTLAIENLSALDSASNFNFSNTTIETVSSIPSAASSTVPIDILDITAGNDLKFNGQPIVLNNDSRLSDARMAKNLIVISERVSSDFSITTIPDSYAIQGYSYTIILYNDSNLDPTPTDYVISLATSVSIGNRSYSVVTPDGNPIELTCPAGGYSEINLLIENSKVYARGI